MGSVTIQPKINISSQVVNIKDPVVLYRTYRKLFEKSENFDTKDVTFYPFYVMYTVSHHFPTLL